MLGIINSENCPHVVVWWHLVGDAQLMAPEGGSSTLYSPSSLGWLVCAVFGGTSRYGREYLILY